MKGEFGIVKTQLAETKPRRAAATGQAVRGYDDDLPPMTEAELSWAEIVPRVKTLRRVLRLTQEQFSERYGIPLGTLRDWEQGTKEPDAAPKSNIRCIMGDAEGVARAFRRVPPAPGSGS